MVKIEDSIFNIYCVINLQFRFQQKFIDFSILNSTKIVANIKEMSFFDKEKIISVSLQISDHIMQTFDFLVRIWYNYRTTTLAPYSDLEIKLGASVIFLTCFIAYWYLSDWIELQKKRGIYVRLMRLPIIGNLVRKEVLKTTKENAALGLPKAMYEPMVHIPKKGWSRDEIVGRLEEFHQEERRLTSDGKFSGIRFSDRKDVEEIAGEGAKRFLYSNLLYFDKTGPSRQMEIELISWVNKL